MKLLLALALVLHTSSAFLFSGPEWNGLRVGFGLNPFSAFDGMPRTVKEAVEFGWSLDRSAGGCDVSGSYFSGNRYLKDNDPGAMLLFDKNGYIAGIQAGIPKTQTEKYPAPQNARYSVFNEEPNHWVITAYFVEPSTICSQGRSESDFNNEGTGNMLSIQTGPTINSLMRIPMDENKVESTTKFVAGKCFVGMGMHYWYDRLGQRENMSCDDTFPIFLLYNTSNRLAGFGWAFNPDFGSSSPRWEHPERSKFGMFMKTPPKCLGLDGPTTTLHIYMTNFPQSHNCFI